MAVLSLCLQFSKFLPQVAPSAPSLDVTSGRSHVDDALFFCVPLSHAMHFETAP